jgi:hypothetical protein
VRGISVEPDPTLAQVAPPAAPPKAAAPPPPLKKAAAPAGSCPDLFSCVHFFMPRMPGAEDALDTSNKAWLRLVGLIIL